MGRGALKKKGLVHIDANFRPEIKTIQDVIEATDRTRQQIEANDTLNFGLVLGDGKYNTGLKVVIDDEALQNFILKCRVKDGKRVPVVAPKEAKQPIEKKEVTKPITKSSVKSALDRFMDEMESE